jgi:hypothetical protein
MAELGDVHRAWGEILLRFSEIFTVSFEPAQTTAERICRLRSDAAVASRTRTICGDHFAELSGNVLRVTSAPAPAQMP